MYVGAHTVGVYVYESRTLSPIPVSMTQAFNRRRSAVCGQRNSAGVTVEGRRSREASSEAGQGGGENLHHRRQACREWRLYLQRCCGLQQ